jgi:stearoyl-CoA desaturase (Delta-9 desaturase)
MVSTNQKTESLEQHGSLSWGNAAVVVGLPLFLLIVVPLYLTKEGVALTDVLIFLAMYAAVGLSITAGYHRCFSHRAFNSHRLLKLFFLCFGAAAIENSALKWCSDHRLHHQYTDKDGDPYNIQRGFLWAHMGWILFPEPSERLYRNIKDLRREPMLVWQDKYYLLLAICFGAVVPTLMGWAFGRPFAGLLWGGLVRIVIQHHATFFVNSWAHYFGRKPYSQSTSARDSFFLALVTNGEGYHNFHHVFASDYRNGVRWYHWDPTKWMVFLGSKIGMTYRLRRVPKSAWKKAMVQCQEEHVHVNA